MGLLRLFNIILLILAFSNSQAQQDSTIQSKMAISSIVQNKDSILNAGYRRISDKFTQTTTTTPELPGKYFKQVDKKIDKYSDRITSKTEKTLTKLSKWENKIKSLLDKTSPETSSRLFGNNKITFTFLLEKLKKGEDIVSAKGAEFDKYRDKLSTSIKYIESQKDKLDSSLVKPVAVTSQKVKELDQDIANSEAVDRIIKERKKQLIDESIKYIGKSKYLQKINKESYYYTQTLKNYKEIFSDEKKIEQTAVTLLNKIPAFQKFFKENSALASLFGNGANYGTAQNLSGLQTRSSINDILSNRIAMGGPNGRQIITQQLQEAQGQLNGMKDRLAKYGSTGDADMPDFKPNPQKSKTFAQRLEFGSNFQFGKSNNFYPATADLGLTIGYKLNDKSIIGIGMAYKLGMGTIDKIQFSHQGIGLRSFIDWKLKKQFFISGGYEMNHEKAFDNFSQLKLYDSWQHAALIGITKKIKIQTRFVKDTNVQLLYDFLHRQHIPVSQPFVFRLGYTFQK